MGNNNKKSKFIAVDVWRPAFGRVSEAAIYQLYKEKSGCTDEEFSKVTLRGAVDFLRKLEKPDYQPKKLK